MARQFFRSVFLLVLLNILVKPLWIFGVDRKMQVLLGYEAYGRYFSYLSFTVILNIVADMGLTVYVQRQIATHSILARKWLRNVVALKLLLSLVYIVLTMFLAYVLGFANGWWIPALIALQVSLSWLSFARSILSAQHRFTASSWFSVLDKLLLIIPGIALLYVFCPDCTRTVEEFIAAQLIAVLLALIPALLLVFRSAADNDPNENAVPLTGVLRQSLPFAVLVLLMFVHSRTDSVLLALLHGSSAQEAGIYASLYRFVDAANVLSYLVAGFLLSFWSKHLFQPDVIRDSLNKMFRIMMAAALLLVVVFFVYSRELQTLVYESPNDSTAQVMQWGILVLIPSFLIDLFGTLVTAHKKMGVFIRILVVCIFLNLTLNFIFIPQQQAWASALIAVGTQSVMALALMFVCSTQWKTRLTTASILRVGALLIGTATAALLLKTTNLSLSMQLVILTVIWIGFVFLLQLFSANWVLNWRREN